MKPSDKAQSIRDMQSAILGVNVTDHIKADKCVGCDGPAVAFKSDLSRREFSISGLCQACQDVVYAPLPQNDNEEDED